MTLTPFRYPGAKNKMLPIIMEHLKPIITYSFVDVFVGGGSVLLEVAKTYPNINLIANDKDKLISSFWSVISNKSKLDYLFSLMETKPTLEHFNKLRENKDTDDITLAYKAIFFNRTTFSGILKSGPIGGKEQKSKYSVDCRYNLKKLKNKIIYCNSLLEGRIKVENKNFSQILDYNLPMYLDPPYYKKGQELYSEFMKTDEHTNLANLLQNKKHWVLSYDDCNEIRSLYKNSQIINLAATYCINGKKDSWKNKNELIILP